MPALLAFLGTAIAKIFGDKVLGYIALKTILVFLFIFVVPVVLNNFLYDIIEIVLNFANGTAEDAADFSGAMTFTGFLAWLIDCFKLAECLAVLVSALVLRTALSMIPFVGVGK